MDRVKIVEKWRRWKQRNKNFPLGVNTNGQWSKRVRGKLYCFGPLEKRSEALTKWNRDKDYLYAGVDPPAEMDGVTLGELCAEHMADCLDRVESGKMRKWSVKDYNLARRQIDAAGISDVPVKALGPQHFTELSRTIERSGLRLRTQKNAIMGVRVILNWGVKNRRCTMPEMGTRFRAPALEEIEDEQEKLGSVRFLDREVLLPAIHYADARMLVVILLGVNCAFYPQDSEAVELHHFYLDHEIPHVSFRRVKTRRTRMAALWPETVAAIRQYLTVRRPADPQERKLLLTQHGRPFSEASAGKSISRLFDNLVETANERPSGASLGSLRHTCATVMGLSSDQPMIDLIMGHVPGGQSGTRRQNLQRRIYTQMNLGELDRLQRVVEIVRLWLYYGDIGTDHQKSMPSGDEVFTLRVVG